MTGKTDKECAQTLIAAAIAAPHNADLRQTTVERNLTTAEMVRGAAYIESGQKVTGTTR